MVVFLIDQIALDFRDDIALGNFETLIGIKKHLLDFRDDIVLGNFVMLIGIEKQLILIAKVDAFFVVDEVVHFS